MVPHELEFSVSLLTIRLHNPFPSGDVFPVSSCVALSSEVAADMQVKEHDRISESS